MGAMHCSSSPTTALADVAFEQRSKCHKYSSFQVFSAVAMNISCRDQGTYIMQGTEYIAQRRSLKPQQNPEAHKPQPFEGLDA
jgi:hypothetical protein